MPVSRAPEEPEVREFETTVERAGDRAVVLAETYFYAESGGQPADRGTVDGVEVTDVQAVDGEVVHHLAADHDLAAGDAVGCVVDDAFRTYCMRAHTASHVLYGAARRLFDDLGYAGFDIGTEKVRVDLTTREPIDDAELVELERLANRAVWDSLPVTWETMPAAEARDLDDIAFNDRTEEGAMSEAAADAVRVVTVEGWDVAACGGTHVRNTSEIGTITVLDRSNPGEDATRVEFAVGPVAVDEAAEVHAAAREASRTLDASVTELPAATERLRDERDDLAAEVRELRAELVGARLRDLPTVEREGATWAVGTVANAGPNDVREPLSELVAGEGGPAVAAVAGEDGSTFLAVATAGPDGGDAADASDVVDGVTDEFGGGGGGGPTFAQGGGLDADPETVAAFLRDGE